MDSGKESSKGVRVEGKMIQTSFVTVGKYTFVPVGCIVNEGSIEGAIVDEGCRVGICVRVAALETRQEASE